MLRGSQGSKDQRTQELGRGAAGGRGGADVSGCGRTQVHASRDQGDVSNCLAAVQSDTGMQLQDWHL